MSEEPEKMQIFVKGLDGKTITLNVSPNEKISDVKKMLEERLGIPVDMQRLLHNGRDLQERGPPVNEDQKETPSQDTKPASKDAKEDDAAFALFD